MPIFYERLPEITQKIADLWRKEPVTGLAWETVEYPEREGLKPIPAESNTKPFWVSAQFEGQTLYAVAKPIGQAPQNNGALILTGYETAAMDKIAFDLAYDLGVPVAPVALWQNAENKPFAISLKPFAETISAHAFGLAMGSLSHMEEALAARHLPELTAITVFNLLVGQGDDHSGNLLLDAQNPKSPCVFIDYHTAFQREVLQSGRPQESGIVDFLPNPSQDKIWGKDHILRAMDTAVATEFVAKIFNLDPDKVAGIVERIPDAFLPPEQKRRVAQFFDAATEVFAERLERRLGGDCTDDRWPAVVHLSDRSEVHKDLRWLLPKGDHLSREEENSLREAKGHRAPAAVSAPKPQG